VTRSKPKTKAPAKARRAPAKKRMPRDEEGASFAGFHVFDLYLNCPWKGFLRHGLGIEPRVIPNPLAVGVAVHEARAEFYRSGGSLKLAEKKITGYFARADLEFEEDGLRILLKDRALNMLRAWVVQYGREDFDRYEILEVERYFELPIPGLPGFVFTGRIDDIRRESKPPHRTLIFDMKTSGYSKTLTEDSFRWGDQSTGYWAGAEKVLGLHVDAIKPDIVYFPRASKDPSKIECLRTVEVVRRPKDIDQFLGGVRQTYSEIAQKLSAIAKGADPRMLFPRNTHYCVSYGHNCEYAGICRLDSTLEGKAPKMFFRAGAKGGVKTLRKLILDSLAEC
jgi:hypothetical protein